MAAMTQEEVDRIVERIRPHGPAIRADADAGDRDAQHVISGYTMITKCAEHGALAVCENGLDAWLRKKGLAK